MAPPASKSTNAVAVIAPIDNESELLVEEDLEENIQHKANRLKQVLEDVQWKQDNLAEKRRVARDA